MPEDIDLDQIEERAAQKAAALLEAKKEPKDKFEALSAKLQADGVDKASIDNYVQLFDALTDKKSKEYQKQAAEHSFKEFTGRCYQETLDAVEDVIEPIATLKNLGPGFRSDLVEEVANLVMKEDKYKEIKRMIEEGRVPPAKKFREAAAEVADKKAKELGLAQKPGQLDLTSSKGQPKEENLSADDLPPGARKFYTIMKNLGKSDAEAMARARQALSEMK